MQYCSYSIRLYFHNQSHPRLNVGFALALSLYSFWSYFSTLLQYHIASLFSSIILGTYWPGKFSFSFLSFCLFIVFMGFSRQEYWSGLPFPSPVDHILSEIPTMTCPSWVALHGMAHSFIGLDKVMVHVMRLVAAAAKSLQSCPTLWDPIEGSPLGCPWDSPGQNTGVGCHCLLQRRLVSFLWL